jgi:hypothetical protein
VEYLDSWSVRNRALAEGLILYERGLGPHGIPMSVATDGELGSAFETETATDHVRAAYEEWHKTHPEKTRRPGQFPRLVDNTAVLRERLRRDQAH